MILVSGNIIGPAEANYGLGNQMFQIATIISYAKDNGYEYSVPDILNKQIYGPYIDNIFKKIKTNNFKNNNFLNYYEKTFNYRPIPPVTQSVILNGYFQSFKYFEHNRDHILDIFQLPHIEELKNKYKNLLEKNTVSVHIRRGDYVSIKHYHSCLSDTDYYEKAINSIDYDVILVFSDDIEWCKTFFNKKNTFYISDTDYNEMFLMSLCKNNIIANSTFSWWGAWLNKNLNKNVIAPTKWFESVTKYTSVDVIPKEWKCI